MADKLNERHIEYVLNKNSDEDRPSGSSSSRDNFHGKLASMTSDETMHQVQMVPSKASLQEHGPPIDHEILPQAAEKDSNPHLLWSRIRFYCQDAFSEFFGVFMMILFGDGVVAQVVLSGGEKGDYQSISWGWGLGVMIGVYVAGKSGGHLNPAVTLCNCVFRGFPYKKFPIYLLSQTLGAFCASLVVYANYYSAIDNFEGVGIRTVPPAATATAGIFCTYPAPFMTRTGMFFSEFVASTILMFCIYAFADNKNLGANNLLPLALFFLIFGIGACFGWETGYAINLARDFGPRLASYAVGYGHEVWSAGGYYFWIPMVSPFFGTLFGAFLYDTFIYTGVSPINTPYMGMKRLVPTSEKGAGSPSHV